jgi:colanic acid/amylovoran biosynthesis glycosyltransferase
VIEDHVSGLLVPPRDPEALAKKILYLLENPQVAEELGRAGRARVVERFSIQNMISQFQRLYGEVVS